MKARFSLLGLTFIVGAFLVLAASRTPVNLTISGALAKPLDQGGAVAVLKIENTGAPDRLIGVSSPVADVELYKPLASDNLPIPTGGASLAFDGAHISVVSTQKPLQDGSLLPLALTFERAGTLTAKARVSDPVKGGRAAKAGLFGLSDICIVGEGEPAPGISLTVVEGQEGWNLRVVADDFTFSKDLLGLYHVPGVGHGRLYVGGMKLGRIFSSEAEIGALPPGRHEIRVTLNTNDHRA